MLTQQRLHDILNYDHETGVFTWKVGNKRNTKAGDIAGNVTNGGYIRIWINGKTHAAHRLSWLYLYGAVPTQQIDHINGIKTDNRLSNLRLATHAQNQQNTKTYANNTSGFKGVTWSRWASKWVAQISIDGRQKRLGYFATAEDAYEVYCEASRRFHGSFANLGTTCPVTPRPAE